MSITVPIVALQARAAIALFGQSLAGIRMLSALAGAVVVFLTGIIIAWALGGRRIAQTLAMLGILLAPEFLALDSFLSMNSFEPVFWMTCVLAILMLLRGASARWWIVFGLAGGLGLENKPSMLVFLVALLLGLLATPQRRLIFSRAALLAMRTHRRAGPAKPALADPRSLPHARVPAQRQGGPQERHVSRRCSSCTRRCSC